MRRKEGCRLCYGCSRVGIYFSIQTLEGKQVPSGKEEKSPSFRRGMLPVQKPLSHWRHYLIVLFTSMSCHSNLEKNYISSGWTDVCDPFQGKKSIIGICGNSCKLNKNWCRCDDGPGGHVVCERANATHETCVSLFTTLLQQCTQPGAIWPFLITWNFLLTLCTVKAAEIYLYSVT